MENHTYWLTKQLHHLLKQADEMVMRSSGDLPLGSVDTISLSSDGECGHYRFINMCVTDSLLMASYSCYLKSDKVRSLFNSHEKIRACMVFLGAGMYNEAKACWLFAQFDLARNTIFNITMTNDAKSMPYFEINAWSEPKNHLHIFNELVLVTYHFDEDRKSPTLSKEILMKTISQFEELGDVYALGMSDFNPAVIILDVDQRMNKAPPQTVKDDYDRVFELQFLLMNRKSSHNHVVVGIFLSDRWVLYDDMQMPKYEDFKLNKADFENDFIIHLAGYVNIPQNEPPSVPFGIPEEGRYETTVFNPSHPSNTQDKEHLD